MRGNTESRPARTWVGTLTAALIALVAAPPAPASAHGADARPEASDYRTEITAVTPSTAGVTVRAVENGARLELRNTTDQTVEIRGYSGEPYLRVTWDGVWTNTRSPATWVNATADGTSAPPASARADTTADPEWSKVSSEPTVRWHDHRTRWMGTSPPPAVTADPSTAHRLASWRVDLLVGGAKTTVTGTLDYEPPPATALWWAAVVLLATALAGLAVLLSGRSTGGRRAGRHLACGALGLAAVAELADAVGRQLSDGETGWGLVGGVLVGQGVSVLVALAALAAATLAGRGWEAGPFAVAFGAACLVLLGGLPDYPAFTHAVPPVPWPGPIARLLALVVLGFGAGAALSAWWWLLRSRRSAALAGVPAQT